MMRDLLTTTFSLMVIAIFMFTACDNDDEPDPDTGPTSSHADSYSPSVAATDDTVYITGDGLIGAEVRLNGELIDLDIETDNKIGFAVKDEMESGPIEIQLPATGDRKTFNNDIYINEVVQEGSSWAGLVINGKEYGAGDVMRGPKTMLVSDFDGEGIRKASSTTTFSNVFWEYNAADGADVGIGTANISPSPAGGNFMYCTILGDDILKHTYGFVGEFETNTERMNDDNTPWPENFVDYPGSIIPQNFDLNQVYLNFYVNNNGYEYSNLRVYIYNDDMEHGERFVDEVPLTDNQEHWHWKSLPMSELRSDFGFGDRLIPYH